MRANSCSLSVRMTEEQYQRLCRYLARCPKARELAPEQIAQLEFLADKLCEEYFLLSTQQ